MPARSAAEIAELLAGCEAGALVAFDLRRRPTLDRAHRISLARLRAVHRRGQALERECAERGIDPFVPPMQTCCERHSARCGVVWRSRWSTRTVWVSRPPGSRATSVTGTPGGASDPPAWEAAYVAPRRRAAAAENPFWRETVIDATGEVFEAPARECS